MSFILLKLVSREERDAIKLIHVVAVRAKGKMNTLR
jgi:hypothetical protein